RAGGRAAAEAVPARFGAGGLRARTAGFARRRRPFVAKLDRASAWQMGGGARGLVSPQSARGRAGLPVGRWDLRQSRAGEREGRAAGGRGGPARWTQGRPGGGERLPGVGRSLGTSAARSPSPRDELASARDRRRPFGDLGGPRCGVSRGGRATMLESQAGQYPRRPTAAIAGRSSRVATTDPLRLDTI